MKKKDVQKKKVVQKEKKNVKKETPTPRCSSRLKRQGIMSGNIEKLEEEEKRKEQKEERVMLVETNSEGKGDIYGNVNILMKRKRYVFTIYDSESEDVFIAKKTQKETLDSFTYENYEGGGNEQFMVIEEMYIEERDVRKELQEALDKIEHLEELV